MKTFSPPTYSMNLSHILPASVCMSVWCHTSHNFCFPVVRSFSEWTVRGPWHTCLPLYRLCLSRFCKVHWSWLSESVMCPMDAGAVLSNVSSHSLLFCRSTTGTALTVIRWEIIINSSVTQWLALSQYQQAFTTYIRKPFPHGHGVHCRNFCVAQEDKYLVKNYESRDWTSF